MGGKLLAGSGCKSKISLGEGNLLGRIIFLKDKGRMLSGHTHLSEITLI